MCQYLLKIAERQNGRSIYRCEHGAFHMVWDSGTFHLFPDDLPNLDLLFTGAAGLKVRSPRNIRLVHKPPHGGEIVHELWIEEMAIRLSLHDYKCMKGLLRDAAQWLEEQPAFDDRKHIRTVRMFSRVDQTPFGGESYLLN